jgi:hypothetical protein
MSNASNAQLFKPTQVTGCVMWLDGADPNNTGTPPANGATISTWTDKSGNGNSASGGTSPTYNSRGINNLGVVSFNGTSHVMNSQDLYGNRSFVVFSVVKRQASISSQTGFLSGSTTFDLNKNLHLVWRTNTNLAMGFYSNDLEYLTFPTYTGNASTEPAYLITWYYTSGTRQIYVNGTLVASDTNSTNLISSAGMILGKYSSSFWCGFIGELLTYNAVLTTTQRQQIEGYLAWKWGLQANLPGTHPYKQAPVYQLPPFPLVPHVQYGTNIIVNRPSILSSAVMWIDAARDSTASGSYVNSITDRGTGGYTISAVSNNTITMVRYGLNGLPYYNLGANRLKVTSLNWRTKFVCFYVFKANNGNFLYSQQPGGIYKQYLYSGNWGLMFINETFGVNDSVLAQGTSVTGSSWCIFTLGYNNGTTASPYNVNGTARTSQTGTSTGDTNLINDTFINGNSTTTFDTSQLAEIIHFNTNLSSTEVSQVEGYLAWKWGLQGLLPSGHAYKSYPFYQATPFPVVPAVTRSTAKSFRPTSITGCQLWLDASDRSSFTLSGTSVTQWNDKSGSGNHATGGTSPTFSNNSVVFNGSSQYLQLTGITSFPSNESWIAVFQFTGSGTNKGWNLLGSSASTGGRGMQVYRVTTDYNFGADKWGTGTIALTPILQNTNYIGGFTYGNGPTNGIFNVYVNGTITGSSPATVSFSGTGSTNLGVGSGNTFYWQGSVSELISYTSTLTAAQRQQVEGYLAWKWGLQTSLPQTHPWKLFPPPPN